MHNLKNQTVCLPNFVRNLKIPCSDLKFAIPINSKHWNDFRIASKRPYPKSAESRT